jgi:hypothetical protein
VWQGEELPILATRKGRGRVEPLLTTAKKWSPINILLFLLLIMDW